MSQQSQIRRLQAALKLLRRLRIDEGHMLLLWAAVCGLLGALGALATKELTSWTLFLFTGSRGGFVEAFKAIPTWQRFAVPVVGALCSGLVLELGRSMVSRRADYMEAIVLGDGVVRFRTTAIRSLAALFAIAAGESIGREGPLVQVAAFTGSLWGRMRGLPPARLRVMVACGAAAGIAGIYHSPLGGAFFVAEIIIGSIAMETLGPLLIASTISALTVQAIEGFDPIYLFPEFSQTSPSGIAAYALAGLATGVVSVFWIRFLSASKSLFGRLRLPIWSRLTLGGLLIGLIASQHPEVCGNGKSLIQGILAGQHLLAAVGLLLLLKMTATAISFGSGAIGGVFTPSLLVGAALGFLLASLLAAAGLPVPPAEMALIGMGAFLAAATRAPATSILMIFEMSMQYHVVLPLMVATVLAYATSRSISRDSLYSESLMQGTRGVLDKNLADISVGELMHKDPTWLDPLASFSQIAHEFISSTRQEIWVAEQGVFRGVIHLGDVGPYLQDPELAMAVIAIDVTVESVPAVLPETPLAEAFNLASVSHLTRLPVLDAQRRLVGEVSRADLFLAISEIARRG